MRFIKLYDQILNWEWYKNPNTFRLFVHLLLRANYCDLKFEGRDIKRGQLVTSLPTLANETGLSIREIRTAINHLKSTGELTDTSTSKYRIITIVKYDDYQSSDRQNDRQATGKRQANDRRATASIESIERIERIDNKDVVDILNVSDSEVAESIARDQQIEEAALSVGLAVSTSAMDRARDLSYRYGLSNLLDAIHASIDVPKWSYVEGILRNAKADEDERARNSDTDRREHDERMKQVLMNSGRWDEEYQCDIEKAEKYRQMGYSVEEAKEDMERERMKREAYFNKLAQRGRMT